MAKRDRPNIERYTAQLIADGRPPITLTVMATTATFARKAFMAAARAHSQRDHKAWSIMPDQNSTAGEGQSAMAI